MLRVWKERNMKNAKRNCDIATLSTAVESGSDPFTILIYLYVTLCVLFRWRTAQSKFRNKLP